MKRCPQCEQWWPEDKAFWYQNKTNKDGLDGWCKRCSDPKSKARTKAFRATTEGRDYYNRRTRAYNRAKTRLVKIYPEAFEMLLAQELEKEGL